VMTCAKLAESSRKGTWSLWTCEVAIRCSSLGEADSLLASR
jgi:hypothetical protein